MATYILSLAHERIALNWKFQQDSDPKHTARLMLGTKQRLPDVRILKIPGWINLNNVSLLKTPAYSADMNPIEHIWAYINYRLRGSRFRSADHCWEEVKKEWEAIPLDKVIDYVDSMLQ